MTTAAELLDALPRMARLISDRDNRFGAVGYGIGRRLVEGRATPERAVLVFVPRKSRRPAARLPSTVPKTDVPIDVVALGANVEPVVTPSLPNERLDLGPASPLALRSGRWHCAAGLAVPLGQPEFMLTVRHPFASSGRGASVFSFRQRIGRLASDSEYMGQDLALVRLARDAEPRTASPDGQQLVGISSAQVSHLGTSVAFFSPVRGSLTRPRVLAVAVTAFLLPWDQGDVVTQRDLVVTEMVTSPGDSGAPLFDGGGSVLGLASFRTDQFSFFEGIGQDKVDALLREVE